MKARAEARALVGTLFPTPPAAYSVAGGGPNPRLKIRGGEGKAAPDETGEIVTVHATEVRVRYADTDQGGVVYNSNYLVFFEVGRTELMRELGCTYADLEREGFVMPVTETGIRFRAPAVYDDLLIVESELTEVERVRLRIDSKVLRASDRRLLAEGFVRLACTDGKGRPVPIPEDTRHALLQDKR